MEEHNIQDTIINISDGQNIKYCEQNNIKVLSLTKDYDLINDLPSTAELAFGLMLSIIRNIPNSFDDVKKGGWDYDMFMGHQLHGKRVGVIGYGRYATWKNINQKYTGNILNSTNTLGKAAITAMACWSSLWSTHSPILWEFICLGWRKICRWIIRTSKHTFHIRHIRHIPA